MRSLSRELGEGVGVLACRLNLSVRELSAGDRDHPQAVCHHLMDHAFDARHRRPCASASGRSWPPPSATLGASLCGHIPDQTKAIRVTEG